MTRESVCSGKQLAMVIQGTMTSVDREVIGNGAQQNHSKTIHTTTMILTQKAPKIIKTEIKNGIQTKSIRRRGGMKARRTLSIRHLKIGTRNRAPILTAM